MEVSFSAKKEAQVREDHGIELSVIAEMIKSGDFVSAMAHPTRDNQTIYFLRVEEYIIAVPCVDDEEVEGGLFIKTAFHSRKYTRRYL